MKTIKTWLATMAVLLCSITASAHDFEVNGIYYNITSSTDKTVEVTYMGNSSDAYSDEYYFSETIPSTVTYGDITYTVTAIGECAFLGCKGVTGVTIPNTVTNIGERAFSGCTKLSNVTLPSSLKNIDADAFYSCESLTTVTIPENITSIGRDAFAYCTTLSKVTYNATACSSIGKEGSFFYGIFNNCSKLTSITIGNNVKKIPTQAFWSCRNITKITIPENVTSIGDAAFGFCSSLREVIYNTKNCTSAGSVDYPIFEGCNSLTTITIGEYVKTIPARAFYGCTKITSITVPNSVTSFGSAAFGGCTGLKSITLPNTLTTIASSLFVGCTSLSAITIPNSVTEISSAAFSGCSSLTNITIPNSVKYIRNIAFEGCTNIIEFNIPSSITEIENLVFNGCSGLTNVIIPNTVTKIGDGAFSGCSKLTDICIPNSVTKIGNGAFKDCTSLTNINIPNTITSLSGVFRGCTSLKNITIPNSVTSLGYTFYDCKSLTDIVIPSSVTIIGDCTFRGCTNLKSVIIPNSVTSIGWAAFSGCSNLTSITIPESVKEITSTVFHDCSALTEVICKNPKPVAVGTNEFYNVPTNTAILYVPKGSKDAYASATGWGYFKNVVEFSLIPEYTITYMVDGNVYYSETIERDAAIPAIDAPIKEGYTFKGWGNLPSTMPDEDITVHAIFTPNNYTVTFKANGKVVSSESLAYGTTIVAPDAPEVEDYAFVEWTGLLETVPARNVEFVAEYVQIGIHIVDGVTSSYIQNEDVEFSRIRYTRTFVNKEVWNAVYLPFEIPMNMLKDKYRVAYINDVHSSDKNGDGEVQVEEMWMEVIEITNQNATLHANHPYLVWAKTDEAKEFKIVLENATLYAADESLSFECSSMYHNYKITGTYRNHTKEELANSLVVSTTGGWVTSTTGMKPFRLRMEVTKRDGTPVKLEISEAKALRIVTYGETTDIDHAEVKEQNANSIYDLMGRRVDAPQKGDVYIVNGKKVVF